MITATQFTIATIAMLAAACDRTPAQPSGQVEAAKAVQTGVASTYGTEAAGDKTANGETLKPNAMTAASKTLPLGSHAQVTNLETGKTARVRINDRGPYVTGRVIDLTPAAAKLIGIAPEDGVARVTVRLVAAPPTSGK
ncbi:MAG: septal ring lytic transglycosylase RlpA family protein [Novosphingobium sp.]